MRRRSILIISAVMGFAALTILSGCGGQGEVAEAINGGAHAADDLPRDVRLPDAPGGRVPGFEDFGNPNRLGNQDGLGRQGGQNRRAIALALATGRKAGNRAQAVGHELAEDGRLTLEQQKQLTCFLTEKAIDGELPRSPEDAARLVGEYFGQDLAGRVKTYKFVQSADDLYKVAEEVGSNDGVSAETAIALVCD
jgi:hypothetical protein